MRLREFFKSMLSYTVPPHDHSMGAEDAWLLRTLMTLALILAVFVAFSIGTDGWTTAQLPLGPSEWQALVVSEDQDADCPTQVEAQAPCRAGLGSDLWTSTQKRSDDSYRESISKIDLPSVWLGLVVPAEKLHRALKESATTLIIGQFFGEYDVWVDGHHVSNGKYISSDIPVQIQLSTYRMAENRELRVAVRVTKDADFAVLDQPELWTRTGFFSATDTDRILRWSMFFGQTRHLLAFAVFVLFALVLSSATRVRGCAYDYVTGAQLGFILAANSLVMSDAAGRFLPLSLIYVAICTLVILEAFFVVRLALAVLRSRRRLSAPLAAVMGFGLGVFLVFAPAPWLQSEGLALLTSLLLPLAYLFAGATIAWRAMLVLRQPGRTSHRRMELLVLMGGLMLITGVSYALESWKTPGLEVHWSRFWNLATLFVLTRWIGRDVWNAWRLVQETPVSRFHRLPELATQIDGWILMLDLRGSELWFRKSAEFGSGGSVVSATIASLWSAVQAGGGQVMQSEGDSLLVLFDDKDNTGAVCLAQALAAIDSCLQDFTLRLRETLPEGAFLPALSVRTAAVRGSVRPTWQTVGSMRIPRWLEAGQTNPFVDLARLMEFERTIENPQNKSLVVLDASSAQDLTQKIALTPREWLARDSERTDKTGHVWRIHALRTADFVTWKQARDRANSGDAITPSAA